MLDGSLIIEAVDDKDESIDIVDQFSVGFLPSRLFLDIYFLGTAQFCSISLGYYLCESLQI